VIGCVTYGSSDCGSSSYNFTVNYTAEEEKNSKIFIPYPLEGDWFLSLQASCSRYLAVFNTNQDNFNNFAL